MAQRDREIRRIVDRNGHRIPLFVRLCEAFVDNLGMILRVALVGGGIYLVQQLGVLYSIAPHGADIAPADHAAVSAPAEPAEPAAAPEPWMTDGIRHALNCTYAEYRERRYDDCVEDGSEVYRGPQPDPNDTGLVIYAQPVLYAGLSRPQTP